MRPFTSAVGRHKKTGSGVQKKQGTVHAARSEGPSPFLCRVPLVSRANKDKGRNIAAQHAHCRDVLTTRARRIWEGARPAMPGTRQAVALNLDWWLGSLNGATSTRTPATLSCSSRSVRHCGSPTNPGRPSSVERPQACRPRLQRSPARQHSRPPSSRASLP